jgi:tetratricopeptide (TPR) repeat protein
LTRFSFAAAALFAISATAPGQTAGDLDRYEAALARRDLPDAARLLDSMIAARRPADGKLRPDPLLSAMAGRYSLLNGDPFVARAFFRAVPISGLPENVQTATALALLEAQERTGDLTGGAATVNLLDAESLTPVQRRQFLLTKARLAMPTNPVHAGDLVQPLLNERAPAARWEAELLMSQAHALSGNLQAAEAAADQAWNSPPYAAARDIAPFRVALQRASLAAARGDRDRLFAMLNLTGASANAVDASLSSNLPLCGERGVLPQDHVTFGVFGGTSNHQVLVPLGAGRPAAIAPFVEALAGRTGLSDAGASPGGTIFTARCRSVPSANYDVRDTSAEEFITWLTERGLFGTFSRLEEDAATEKSAKLEALAARYGEDHPFLILPRMELAELLTRRAAAEGDVEEWQVRELVRKAKASLRTLGGDRFVPPDALEKLQRETQAAASPEEGLRLARSSSIAAIQSSPADQAYNLASLWFSSDPDLPTDTKIQVLERLLKRFAPGDRRRAALLMKLGAAHENAGDQKAAMAAYKAAGVPAMACAAFDAALTMEQNNIGDEDYSLDGIENSIHGTTTLELNLSADGRPQGIRTLIAAPTLVFDPVVAEKIEGFKWSAPRLNGRAQACRALQMTVKWRMPEQTEFQVPTFRQPDPDGT